MPPDLTPVLEHPYDDAPRLAYADALAAEDPGDPRAEWIRLQVRLAKERFAAASAADPTAELERRVSWLAAQRRERELREAHAAGWTAGLRALAPGGRFELVRGFVMGAVVSARTWLSQGAALLRAAPLVSLQLRDVGGHVDALCQDATLERIRALSFLRCGLHDRDLAKLADAALLAQVWWLDLSHCPITIAGLRHLAGSSHLRALRYLGLEGVADDPRETVASEWGRISDVQLPSAGAALERDFGPLAWLHVQTDDAHAYPPSRYDAP